MATYCYLKCRTCNEYSDVIARNDSITKPALVNEFLVKHKGHHLAYGDEYMDEFIHRQPRLCSKCGQPATQSGFLDIPYCDDCYKQH